VFQELIERDRAIFEPWKLHHGGGNDRSREMRAIRGIPTPDRSPLP